MAWRSRNKVGGEIDSAAFSAIDDREAKHAAAAKKRARGADGTDEAPAAAKKKSNVVLTTIAQEGLPKLSAAPYLLHRFAIFACAVGVMVNSISAMNVSLDLLYGVSIEDADSAALSFAYMEKHLGESVVRHSALVTKGLGNDTSPRDGTLYLTPDGPTFSPCEELAEFHQLMYGDTFLRSMIGSVQTEVSGMLKYLKPEAFELIVPVVDCSSPMISFGYRALGRFFYLMRNASEPDNVHVLTITLSANEYSLPAQVETGPTALVTLTIINDTSASAPNTDHLFLVSLGYPFSKLKLRVANLVGATSGGLWQLKVLPWASKGEIAKTIYTSSRSGFYLTSEEEQSNTNNHVWTLQSRPLDAITKIELKNTSVLYNTWSWVRVMQGVVALVLFGNLTILFLVFFRNLQAGKIWVGDAFVSSLGVINVQGIWVMMYWYIEEFWTISEFCIHDANSAAGIEAISVDSVILRADLLAIYMSISSWIGMVLKDRVDPIVVIVTFMVGYECRASIRELFPSINSAVKQMAEEQYASGFLTDNPFQQQISPMISLATRPLTGISKDFLTSVLFPVFLMLVLVVLYILSRKIFFRFFPEKLHVLRSMLTSGATATSENEALLLASRSKFTMFELATGAEMQNRFGMLTDYETCVFMKGIKYATVDGVYSNGFIIANQKFLLQTEDYWYIVFMKLLRWRYINIYVYEVSGTTVQQRARLVYPHTLTWTDLLYINLSILS